MIPLYLLDFTHEYILYFLKFLLPFVSFEKVSMGELLTFISSIVLAIITLSSVSIAKHSSQVANNSLLIQSRQLKASIKPNLIFDIRSYDDLPFDYSKGADYILNNNPFSDYEYFIQNPSDNITYDLSVMTFIYLDNEDWKKYYEYRKEKIDVYNRNLNFTENNYFKKINEKKYNEITIPNIVSENNIHYLNHENKLIVTIPYSFFVLDVLSYDGTITNPKIYNRITYKDKIDNVYEDFFEIQTIGSSYGNVSKSIKFNPRKLNSYKTKEKLQSQKEYLKEKSPNQADVYYL